VVSRYEEALEIIVPLIRDGETTFDGEFHTAFELQNTPRGSRGSDMPIMLAGHGTRTISLAVKHGDIWSAFATESSLPDAFDEMMKTVDRICEEQGRDPKSLGRSIGVFVELTEARFAEEIGLGTPLRGSPAEVADQIHTFSELGVTMLELIPGPFNEESIDKIAELIEILDA
jgi:alkanesulfonate monooxygenase SsuD/methylene tetrahydromethanopterin reductase-like flavin-dependent oxidoreductase (luciferase family)